MPKWAQVVPLTGCEQGLEARLEDGWTPNGALSGLTKNALSLSIGDLKFLRFLPIWNANTPTQDSPVGSYNVFLRSE